jgi:hypothetical protein
VNRTDVRYDTTMSLIEGTRPTHKVAYLVVARACGQQQARQNPGQEDPLRLLHVLDPAALDTAEREALTALPLQAWQHAFTRGWRSVRCQL